MDHIQREQRRVKVERRKHPRIECNFDATVTDIQDILSITSISLGGIYIETNNPDNIDVGRTITISTKLPSERYNIKLKAKVVRQNKRGIGCQFVKLKGPERKAICSYFVIFKDTLPA